MLKGYLNGLLLWHIVSFGATFSLIPPLAGNSVFVFPRALAHSECILPLTTVMFALNSMLSPPSKCQ